jgi:hypothetical protein
MLAEDLKNKISLYSNFEIWDVENIDAFFKGNGILTEIFEKEYKIKVSDFHTKRNEIVETDAGLMALILDLVADKYFSLFTLNDINHLELIFLQEQKIMNFGVDITQIKPNHFYILIMDKA